MSIMVDNSLDSLSIQYLTTGFVGTTKHQEERNYDPYQDGCNHCGAPSYCIEEQFSDGDVVCTECGIALICNIHVEKDWNDYKDDQGVFSNNARCHQSYDSSNPFDTGALPKYPKGYKQEYTDKQGNKRVYDMSKLNVRYISHKQKDFWQVSCKLKEACERMGAQGALTNAKQIWTIVAKSDKVCRGANRRGIIGNCLLSGCYQSQTYRKQDEIAEALSMPSSEITKGRKIYKEILLAQGRADILNLKPGEKSKFASLASNLGLPRTHWNLVYKSEEMYKKLQDELSILAPSSGIAGVLFYNITKAGFKITKSDIKRVCEVCTPTLNKALKIIEKVVQINNK